MVRIFMVGMSNDKGGVEAYITNLCSSLSKDEFEVLYCWPEMRIDGKTWVCPANRHNYLKYFKFWKRFYKENHFDVLYFNTCDVVSIDALKFAKAAGIPIRIIHSHNTGNQQGIEKKMSLFHRLCEKHSRKTLDRYATHMLACSQEAGEWMFPGHDFTIIKNGINLNKYTFCPEYRDECRQSLEIGPKYLVGCIGRLDPQKNPLKSVELMKAVSEITPDVKFVFVGDGELRQRVEQRIKEYRMDDKIILLGARNDANKWYAALDCLIMPSLFEGLPFVLVEAQAAGLPCVVSSTVSKEANLTGLVEYVALEEEPKIWAKRILRACRKNRIDVTQKLIDAGYSIENTAEQVAEMIEKALRKA